MNARHLAGLPLMLAGLLAGCLAPPAVQPGLRTNLNLAAGLYPTGAALGEVQLASGERLRGLYVPAGEHAPVVLHLLESSGSAATLFLHYGVLCHRLQGLGFASLILDYRGIGASDGTRSADHLREDAGAMWAAAVQLAGDDPERVVVRGISLGCVATAVLLEGGARPGAVVLHAPVFPDSAITRFAQKRYGPLFGGIAGLFYRSIAGVDLAQELESYGGPCLVKAGSKDFFLSDSERNTLARAVEVAPRLTVEVPPTGHLDQTLYARSLDSSELALLTGSFPPRPLDAGELEELLRVIGEDPRGGPAARARVDVPEVLERLAVLGGQARNVDPLLLAAIAIANEANEDSLRYLWMLDDRGLDRDPSFDQTVDAVSLRDPTGPLSIDTILSASQLTDLHMHYGSVPGIGETIYSALMRVDLALSGEESAMTMTMDFGWERAEMASGPGDYIEALRSRSIPEDAVRRASARALLKGARIPERVLLSEAGTVRLQVLENGIWTDQDLDPNSHPAEIEYWQPTELGWRASVLVGTPEGVPLPTTLSPGNGEVKVTLRNRRK